MCSAVAHAARARRVDLFLKLQQACAAEAQAASRPITVTIQTPHRDQEPAHVIAASHTTVPAQLMRGISNRNQIAACRVNGHLWDLMRPLTDTCHLQFLFWDTDWDYGLKEMCWHSGAHVLGAALEEVYGDDILLCDGPPVKRGAGFFYEGHLKHGQTVNTDALAQVEKHMHELCRLQHDLQRIDVTPEQALDVFCDNPFKQHFIHRAQQQGETSISIYKLASFVDLCEGPHIRNLRPFSSKTIALTSTSQAEFDWSGREEMKPDNWDTHTPLTRTYGICFPSKQMFRHWKRDVEEREKYNHSAVGKSLSIFMQHDTSPGPVTSRCRDAVACVRACVRV
ncbi:hypothetical protein PTSG_11497 [Salpingoeca rosetta]|uniref:TGS domain-containing protein n=1 Tax=Salpingoeca rosetta (strain ATCC 50818 / BSB-021) TaxID=946362 RepID=F2UTM8_SALR5|nr:uncharacterized protein PTSG_11497 [Salpingoeca rosetta]EGD73377.1 hypothetical protein PTSG_11497 [Salpingoeca rosetta]|eukprot:XP_004987477.1 hypothetical protein PTSG_11497 [Salpingoeca rosetta]